MDTKYFLSNGTDSTLLFTLPYEYRTEEPAVYDFYLWFIRTRDLKAEDLIRDFHITQFGRPAMASSPIVLLKLLLANGFTLRSHYNEQEFILAKDFFAIHYQAQSKNQVISFGSFFRTSVTNVDEQFPVFCKWLDTLCGLPGTTMHLAQQCISDGFSIVAVENERETWLVRSNEFGDVLSAQEHTLTYLTNSWD